MRIWVTGIGVVSPLARGAQATMDRLLGGDRAIGPLSLFEVPGSRVQIAAEVKDLRAEEVAPPGEAEQWSRTDAMSVLAVREALAHAQVCPSERTPVDLIVGGTTAGMFETEDLLAWLSRETEAITPLKRMLSHPLSSTGDHVNIAAGPFRHIRSVCSACSSGANAILLAAAWIRAGLSSCVVAGGADGLCRLTYTGFGALAALDPNPCRPFDRARAGLNLGEGAAFLVLEPDSAVRARGGSPVVELRGWAVGAEAHHITNPEREGRTAARIMRKALDAAALLPADVDYINAHGTATPLNDPMEAAALHECLGAEVERIAVSSSKGQIGHTLGAAGAIEAAITAMAVSRGAIPPTIGLSDIDPDCRLVHVLQARAQPIRAAMSNSFGFGGTDTVLVFTPPELFALPAEITCRPVLVTAAATVGPLGVHGVAGSGGYLAPGPSPEGATIQFDAKEHLDIARARRLDRAARLVTVAVATSLREASLRLFEPEPPRDAADAAAPQPPADDVSLRIGAIVGASFGSVDGSTVYMRRIYDKGAKYASPAEFPNLVPSSPVGHASIYLGLRGPVFAVSDLGATTASAIITSAELLAAGEGDVIAAGSVEETSPLVEKCLGPICSGVPRRGVRSEGAVILLLETEQHVRARGARAIASLSWWHSWRGDGAAALAGAPLPPAEAWAVIVAEEDPAIARILHGSPWARGVLHTVARRSGHHEGASGFAAAAAISALAAGTLHAALVLGSAPDRGYAMLFARA
jgi:3-oxoacyl-[acyl-carrier-protein] synthase II